VIGIAEIYFGGKSVPDPDIGLLRYYLDYWEFKFKIFEKLENEDLELLYILDNWEYIDF